ncbi:uncharacterized protein B0H64DRAFT_179018 [Chaetomium fimeti]|uniref:Uncharacterized protein n=1 Tax=Chaetomium fimeti TaxID=1854472 RepID=A0AAE0LQZ0_9PEZI|nr:hypothetical protein B0H64DRAFT_179018 [Chaetomium fimeti]
MLSGTQRLAVSSLFVSGRPSGRAATSGQVILFRVIFGHRLSPASTPHSLSTTSDYIDAESAVRPCPALPLAFGRPGRPWQPASPSTPPSLKNKESSQQGWRVSDHVSVLIGQFSCVAVAQNASSWGQARLGAVTDAPCRTAAAKLGRRMRGRLLEEAWTSLKKGPVVEGERLRSRPVLAASVLRPCASGWTVLSPRATAKPTRLGHGGVTPRNP